MTEPERRDEGRTWRRRVSGSTLSPSCRQQPGDLYDDWNTRYLAQKDRMMTCTDGRTPGSGPDPGTSRPYGAFSKKLRDLVLDEDVISLPSRSGA